MSTRGSYGFRKNQIDKVTYNHCDSYPTYLGREIFNFVKSTEIDELKRIANDIKLVAGDSKPTPDNISNYRKFSDLGVSEQTVNDWYCLIHSTQGNLAVYKDGEVSHMIDGESFLKDSLFCEWAYIINLDSMKLEVYKGWNKNKSAKGRYAKFETKGEEYCGVELIKEVNLVDVHKMDDKQIEKLMQELDK